MDGYSQLIVFLHASTNNQATTVYDLFVAAVWRHHLPSRVHSDQGTENILVAQYMLEKRGADRRSMITGCSVHNQRIERLWKDMHRSVTVLFYKMFYYLEQYNLLDHLNEHHLWAFYRSPPSRVHCNNAHAHKGYTYVIVWTYVRLNHQYERMYARVDVHFRRTYVYVYVS